MSPAPPRPLPRPRPTVGPVFTHPPPPSPVPARLPLPEPWRGLRDEALSQRAGVPGCVFVHASGFIGGNRSREGALAMARRALEQRDGG